MLIATDRQAFALDTRQRHAPPHLLASGAPIAALAERGDLRLVITGAGDALLFAASGAKPVPTGIAERICSAAIVGLDPWRIVIGTEPPHVFRLAEGQEGAERMDAFDALECRSSWHTPWGGPPAVRSLAYTSDGWVYADIHVGSIMRSPDGGTTWEPVAPKLHEDVHQVATCPATVLNIYANTADAVWVSRDRGASWIYRGEGLDGRYGRAIAVHPDDPAALLATVSDGPHGDDVHGQLYRSTNQGVTWSLCEQGFPASVSHNIDTFHVAYDAQGAAWAVVGDTLYRSANRGATWHEHWHAPEPIERIACSPS
jgi:hypothetical protein